MTNNDIHYMRYALRLAARGLGRTWPNPSVGAVVVHEGIVLGTGITARGGRPHAETEALAMAGERARGATLYVTLEPCAHQGKTPPCTLAIITAGIARVVAACTDTNPKVGGKGFAQLREAGIEVTEGMCEKEALSLAKGFFSVIERGRPFVTLKLATSLDGKITDTEGKTRWITGEESRRRVHALRASQDAILTGIGTVLADNPELTCRLPGRETDSPQRIVMDSRLSISPDARILPAWVITAETMLGTPQARALESNGTKVLAVGKQGERLSLLPALELIAKQGITRLMIEAGGTLAGEVVREGLADRIYWYRAPLIIGEKGMAALQGQEPLSLATLPRYRLINAERIGSDTLEVYDREAI